MLRVMVEERVAAAVLETEDGLYYLDAYGERIARLEPGDSAASLVRIAAGATAIGISPALATSEAASVRHALAIESSLEGPRGPEWRLPVLWVEVIGDDDYRVYLGALPFPILVRSRTWRGGIDAARAAAPRDPRASADPRRGRSALREPRDRAAGDRGDPSAAAAAAKAGRRRGGAGGRRAPCDGPPSDEPMQSTRSSVWDPQPKET